MSKKINKMNARYVSLQTHYKDYNQAENSKSLSRPKPYLGTTKTQTNLTPFQLYEMKKINGLKNKLLKSINKPKFKFILVNSSNIHKNNLNLNSNRYQKSENITLVNNKGDSIMSNDYIKKKLLLIKRKEDDSISRWNFESNNSLSYRNSNIKTESNTSNTKYQEYFKNTNIIRIDNNYLKYRAKNIVILPKINTSEIGDKSVHVQTDIL